MIVDDDDRLPPIVAEIEVGNYMMARGAGGCEGLRCEGCIEFVGAGMHDVWIARNTGDSDCPGLQDQRRIARSTVTTELLETQKA